jgi:DNA repair protein RecO (recombination protein O)
VPLVSTRAVVLQGFPYGETSKILRILSAEYGVRSVIAKGAMRPRSRFGGLLDPFTEGEAHLVLKEGRELHTLGGFDLIRARRGIGRNFAAFSGASLLVEVVLRCGTDEPQPDVFSAVVTTLDDLAALENDHPWTALGGVWQVVALLGYEPELTHCVVCGRRIADDEETRFDVRAGGIACTDCRPKGRLVPARARRELHGMIAGHRITPEDLHRGLHRSLLVAFLSEHLTVERPLRSLDLFLDELR